VRFSNVLIVYKKELTEALRDRRTLYGMFIFPMVVFPLLTVGFNRVQQRFQDKVKAETASVMLLGEEQAPALAGKLRAAEGLHVVPYGADYAAQINNKTLRAAVEFPSGFETALAANTKEAPKLKIYYQLAEVRSGAAADRLEEVISEYRKDVVAARVSASGLSETFVKPVETKQENVASEQKVSGNRLGILVPYFMIFLCLAGAIHPAIDLTAGEKERGTLETILASSVHRGELVLGKFLLVLTTALTTTAVAMMSYGFTLSRGGGSAQITNGAKFTLSISTAASILLLILPLAVLFASSLLAIALMAKSYKEAQSYIQPLMIVVILPAVVAMLPGVELNYALAMIPIINISLVMRELLTGNFPLNYLAVTFASTAALAAIALHTAYDMFQREEVLFRS